MKTQIITLESHDDLISVRDRMSWAKTPRILLVWPKYEKVTLRQVDLKILQRHAASLGAQLGLVSRIRRVRMDAEALHIPVFKSTGDAQKQAWPTVRRRRRVVPRPPRQDLREKREQVIVHEEAWRSQPGVRILAFFIGVLAVLAMVALFIPRARITLTPITKTQSLVLPVVANPAVDSVFITGNIPAREKHVTVEGNQTINVTGEGIIPQSKARGIAEFRNLTQQAVAIPSGTIVQNKEGIRFVTTVDSEMEAGVGSLLQLPIEAVDGGLAGNLDAEKIDIIAGRLGLSLSVTNPEPTEGGRELPSIQASEADRERVKKLLMKNLKEEARQKLAAELSPGDVLFDQSMTVTQTLLEEYDPPAGAAGANLTLNMRLEFTSRYADASDLIELAALALNASLPTGFHPAAPDEIIVRPDSIPNLEEDGSAKWTMLAERKIVQLVDPMQVTRLVQGLGVWNTEPILEEHLRLAAAPKVELTPSWWPWMPIVPFRIAVMTP